LGDNQALTMPQRFYQRALSADSDEIIAGARAFLKRIRLPRTATWSDDLIRIGGQRALIKRCGMVSA